MAQLVSSQAMGASYLANHVWGTPDVCVERLQSIADAFHPEEFMLVFRYGSMPRDVAEKSIGLFAREVLPAVHAIELQAPITYDEVATRLTRRLCAATCVAASLRLGRRRALEDGGGLVGCRVWRLARPNFVLTSEHTCCSLATNVVDVVREVAATDPTTCDDAGLATLSTEVHRLRCWLDSIDAAVVARRRELATAGGRRSFREADARLSAVFDAAIAAERAKPDDGRTSTSSAPTPSSTSSPPRRYQEHGDQPSSSSSAT